MTAGKKRFRRWCVKGGPGMPMIESIIPLIPSLQQINQVVIPDTITLWTIIFRLPFVIRKSGTSISLCHFLHTGLILSADVSMQSQGIKLREMRLSCNFYGHFPHTCFSWYTIVPKPWPTDPWRLSLDHCAQGLFPKSQIISWLCKKISPTSYLTS